MSSLIFPTLPGLTFDVVRTPVWNTEKQKALSGKRSALAYMQYPLIHFEMTFSVLRDDVSPSEIKQVVGLFNAVQAGYDTFLFTDPDFNTVTNMQFGVTDGTTLSFQTTANYGANGYNYGEIIQNISVGPLYSINRYGSLIEYPATGGGPRTVFTTYSQDFTNSNWVKTNLSAAVAAQSAPDGTFTANVLQDTTNSNVQHSIAEFGSGSTFAGVYTFSVFVWCQSGALEAGFIDLSISDNAGTPSTVAAVFNINTCTLVSEGSAGPGVLVGPVAEIQSTGVSVGGGTWYRLSLAFTRNAPGVGMSYTLIPQQVAGVGSYAGTNGVAAGVWWGAQFENTAIESGFIPGLALPAMYIPTSATQVTQNDLTSYSATAVVTINSNEFGSIPGIKLLWTGSFYYRCAFDEDKLELTKFMNKWWTIKKLPFTSIKL